MNVNTDNAEWLRQIAEGNETAFKALFDMYWDHVYSVAFMLTKSASHSEDMVQEIFFKIWTKREELPAVERLESYLFIVARNHIYNVLKKHSREQDFKRNILNWFESDHETPEQQLLFKESSALLQQAVNKLTPQQQTIYRMTKEQGLSYEQVAGQLGISTNTVRNHIVSALKIIREYIGQHASPVIAFIALLNTLH